MKCTLSRGKRVNENGSKNYEGRVTVLSTILVCDVSIYGGMYEISCWSGYFTTTSSLLCSRAGLRKHPSRVHESTKPVMAHETLGYAVLCTDAYIVDVRVNNIERTSSCFDVALPCGNHLLQHEQPVIACCFQYESKEALTHVPHGIYHICAKVRAQHPTNANVISHV